MIRESSGRDFSRIYHMLLSESMGDCAGIAAENAKAAAGAPYSDEDEYTEKAQNGLHRDQKRGMPLSVLYEVNPDEDEELEKYLAYIHTVYPVFGIGLCSVVLKDSDEVIGWCGLQPIGDEDTPLGRIELGYLIGREWRRQGYAMEACRAILDFAFCRLELDEVYAQIDERNAPSLHLAQKLGFRKLKTGLWVVKAT